MHIASIQILGEVDNINSLSDKSKDNRWRLKVFICEGVNPKTDLYSPSPVPYLSLASHGSLGEAGGSGPLPQITISDE